MERMRTQLKSRAGEKMLAAVASESPGGPCVETHPAPKKQHKPTQAIERNNLKAAGKTGQNRRSKTRVTGPLSIAKVFGGGQA